MAIQAMDSSHVAMVFLGLKKDAFETFRISGPARFGVSVPNFSKILKLANHDDSMVLQKSADGAQLKIVLENALNERVTTFEMNLLSIESDHVAIPDMVNSSSVTLNSNEFSRLTREFYALSDAMTMMTDPDHITFEVESEIGKGSTKIN